VTKLNKVLVVAIHELLSFGDLFKVHQRYLQIVRDRLPGVVVLKVQEQSYGGLNHLLMSKVLAFSLIQIDVPLAGKGTLAVGQRPGELYVS
jgi:hypothetical protein